MGSGRFDRRDEAWVEVERVVTLVVSDLNGKTFDFEFNMSR